jgi:hypothetical protein
MSATLAEIKRITELTEKGSLNWHATASNSVSSYSIVKGKVGAVVERTSSGAKPAYKFTLNGDDPVTILSSKSEEYSTALHSLWAAITSDEDKRAANAMKAIQ